MLNAHLAEAHIKLISKKPVTKKFDYATVGGFTVKTKNSENVPVDFLDAGDSETTDFDWARSDGNSFNTTNGHMGIEWKLSEFDNEHFAGNDDPSDTPDWERIVTSILTNVQYDNGHIDPITNEETHVPMVLTGFKIVVYNHDYSESRTYAFSTQQIADYNKRTNTITV